MSNNNPTKAVMQTLVFSSPSFLSHSFPGFFSFLLVEFFPFPFELRLVSNGLPLLFFLQQDEEWREKKSESMSMDLHCTYFMNLCRNKRKREEKTVDWKEDFDFYYVVGSVKLWELLVEY